VVDAIGADDVMFDAEDGISIDALEESVAIAAT
jgi:hypothetical protein